MRIVISILLLGIIGILKAQEDDQKMIRGIFDEVLLNGEAYSNLEDLTSNVGARLSGSPEAAAAVEWSKQIMEGYGFDKVYLQEVMVPHWVRGEREVARIASSNKYTGQTINVRALGKSVGTGEAGIVANVIEIKELSELEKLGKKGVEGKIVFINKPMDQRYIETGNAYGDAYEIRGDGPSEAAKYGAIGVVIRSLSTIADDFPHTGSLNYVEDLPKIPAVAAGVISADLLSKALKDDKDLKLFIKTNCETLPDVLSFNVIGEIMGSEKPEEIIVVGGHLDSWDLGTGAHDDGSGCVHSIEAMRALKAIGYKPKRTIRVVMFMNEENGLKGGKKYAEIAKEKGENHIAALESDSGGFAPRGFNMSGDEKAISKVSQWRKLFEPYGIYDFSSPGGGADIGPLEDQGTLLIGLVPESQRYFDYHHTDNDTFDKVNKRELHLGAAGMASLIYMIDKYGL